METDRNADTEARIRRQRDGAEQALGWLMEDNAEVERIEYARGWVAGIQRALDLINGV